MVLQRCKLVDALLYVLMQTTGRVRLLPSTLALAGSTYSPSSRWKPHASQGLALYKGGGGEVVCELEASWLSHSPRDRTSGTTSFLVATATEPGRGRQQQTAPDLAMQRCCHAVAAAAAAVAAHVAHTQSVGKSVLRSPIGLRHSVCIGWLCRVHVHTAQWRRCMFA